MSVHQITIKKNKTFGPKNSEPDIYIISICLSTEIMAKIWNLKQQQTRQNRRAEQTAASLLKTSHAMSELNSFTMTKRNQLPRSKILLV